MRIISQASSEIKCGNCRTHFEYDTSDIRFKTEHPGYDEYEPREVYYVACPTCGRNHSVNASGHQKQQVQNSIRLTDDY